MHLTAYEMIENAKKGLHRGKGGKHFISNMVKYVRYSKKNDDRTVYPRSCQELSHFTVSRKKMVKTTFYISAILVAWSVFEPPFLNKSI